MYKNDDDNNNTGNQKGSLLDWLLTFFLIRKSQEKTAQNEKKQPKTIIPSPTKNQNTIKPIRKEEEKTVVNTLSKNPNLKNQEEDVLTNPIIERIIEIDNILKQDSRNDQEIKEIIDKINKTIKKQLTKCQEDLDKIYEQIPTTEKEKEIIKLQKQLQEICNQLILLQYRVESLKKGRFYNYSPEENQNIIAMVKDLNNFSSKENITSIIVACEAKLITTMEFLNTESKQEYVADSANTKGSTIAIRSEYFAQNQGKLAVVKDIESITKMTIYEQEQQIKRIKKEIQELEPTVQQINHIKGFGNIFGNTLKLIWGIFSLPLSSTKSKLFGSILIGNSIKGLKKGLDFQTEQIVYYEYSKFNYAISSTVNRLDDIDYILKNALTDLKELKINYNYHFQEYQYSLPEYAEFYAKIEELENKIVKEREIVQQSIETIKSQKKDDKILTKKVAA